MAGTTPIVIAAAGGFGREVAWLIEEINRDRPAYELIGFIDDTTDQPTPEGVPVIAGIEAWAARPKAGVEVVCAVGEPWGRKIVVDKLERAGVRFATLVHPGVRMSRHVEIGAGSILCAGNILTTSIRLGRHVILNLDCTVGHDSSLGSLASIMPGVHVSGRVVMGEGVYVGTGAAIVNKLSIGEWSVIGAGAVVASDLPARQVCVGVPAKPVKPNVHAPGKDA